MILILSSTPCPPIYGAYLHPGRRRNSDRNIIDVYMNGFPQRLYSRRATYYLLSQPWLYPNHSWENLIDYCDKGVWSGICCTTMTLWRLFFSLTTQVMLVFPIQALPKYYNPRLAGQITPQKRFEHGSNMVEICHLRLFLKYQLV